MQVSLFFEWFLIWIFALSLLPRDIRGIVDEVMFIFYTLGWTRRKLNPLAFTTFGSFGPFKETNWPWENGRNSILYKITSFAGKAFPVVLLTKMFRTAEEWGVRGKFFVPTLHQKIKNVQRKIMKIKSGRLSERLLQRAAAQHLWLEFFCLLEDAMFMIDLSSAWKIAVRPRFHTTYKAESVYCLESVALLVSSVVIGSVSKARYSDVVSKNWEVIMGIALFCNHESPAYHSVVKAG